MPACNATSSDHALAADVSAPTPVARDPATSDGSDASDGRDASDAQSTPPRIARALHFVVDTSDESAKFGGPSSTVMRSSIFAAAFDRIYGVASAAPPVLGLTMFPARTARAVIYCAASSECPWNSHCTSIDCQPMPVHHGLCDACMTQEGSPDCSSECASPLSCPGVVSGTLMSWPDQGRTFCISNFDCAGPSLATNRLPLDESRSGQTVASTLSAELVGGPTDIRASYVAALADAEHFGSNASVGVAAVVLVLSRSTMSLGDRCTQRGDLAVLAEKQLAAGQHVKTFVVAQGPIPQPGSLAETNLDAIARAGGTERARIVDCASLACPDLDAVLEEIRTTPLP